MTDTSTLPQGARRRRHPRADVPTVQPAQDTPGIDPLSGTPYAGEWFEINRVEYHFMLDLLPPLFMRTGMFGMSEYKAGNVTSVFFAIRIRGRERWFHGFCDLTDQAVARHDARRHHRPRDRRERQHDARGKARGDLEHHPCRAQGDRPQCRSRARVRPNIAANAPFSLTPEGMMLSFKLLDDLSDDEIDKLLSVSRSHRNSRKGGDDADRS